MTALPDTGFLLAVLDADSVDCVIAAMAERLEIETILTVDRRHFQLFRPRHTTHFNILPQ